MFVLPHIFFRCIFSIKRDYPNICTVLVEEATDGAAFMCTIQSYSPVLLKVETKAYVSPASP